MMKSLILLALADTSLAAQVKSQKIIFGSQAATGATSSVAAYIMPRIHTLQFVVTGGPGGCSIKLEGSLDNTNIFTLGVAQTCTSSLMYTVVDVPIAYVRINLVTLTGGTAPTVTTTYLGVQ